jgi:hypothetical protein
MSQSSIALLVLAPTVLNFAPIERKTFLVPGPFGMIVWQSKPFLLKTGHPLLEFVNLAAGAGLLAIKAPCV